MKNLEFIEQICVETLCWHLKIFKAWPIAC